MKKQHKMYIVHDLLTDRYKIYKHLTKLSEKEKISRNTLNNKFTREKLNRYTTKDARIIIRLDPTT